jgi:hypothetical protein
LYTPSSKNLYNLSKENPFISLISSLSNGLPSSFNKSCPQILSSTIPHLMHQEQLGQCIRQVALTSVNGEVISFLMFAGACYPACHAS